MCQQWNNHVKEGRSHVRQCTCEVAVSLTLQRSVGEVQWSNADNRNIYRLGHRGKVDLKCKEVGNGEDYYVEHLPVLGEGGEGRGRKEKGREGMSGRRGQKGRGEERGENE